MANLQVIGAGLPRTGTSSLRDALEQLLGGGCYHMARLFDRVKTDGLLWFQALDGDLDALDQILADWVAAVDWPTSILWRELAERHPEALVLLSHRGSAEVWWESADATVWAAMRRSSDDPLITAFNDKMLLRSGLGDRWDDPSFARAFYEQHFAEVIDTISPDRLLVWQPSEGWEPLCAALGLPVPEGDFIHTNDRAEFQSRMAEPRVSPRDVL